MVVVFVRNEKVSSDIWNMLWTVLKFEREKPNINLVICQDKDVLSEGIRFFPSRSGMRVWPIVQGDVLEWDVENATVIVLGEIGVESGDRADDTEQFEDVSGDSRVGHNLRKLVNNLAEELCRRGLELKRRWRAPASMA